MWPRVRSITEATIGYPNRNFLLNFVAIAQRVTQVTEFVNVLCLVDAQTRQEPTKWALLRHSLLQLSKKPTPSAVFRLDLLKDVAEGLNPNRSSPVVRMADAKESFELQMRITSLMNEFSVHEFKVLRIDSLFVHELDLLRDPFHARVANRVAKVGFLHKTANRLVIGCLRIQLQWSADSQDGCVLQAIDQMSMFQRFPQLELIEVESVQLKMSPPGGGEPSVLVDMDMRSQPCQFASTEFESFLSTMAETSNDEREAALLEHIDGWFARKLVSRCALHLHSDEFDVIKTASDLGSRLTCAPYKCISMLCLEKADSLHLRMDKSYDEIEAIVVDLRPAFAHLKQLTFSFAPGVQAGARIIWDQHRGACVARALVGRLRDLQKLESLSLDLLAFGPQCPALLCHPMEVGTDTLPALTTVECHGMPAFPFLMALVANAPKLRHLIVTSQPFADDEKGFRAMASLVASLKRSKQLACVVIHIDSQQMPTGVPGVRVECESRMTSRQHPLLLSLSEEVKKLMVALPNLVKASVSVKYYDYSFHLHRPQPSGEVARLLDPILQRGRAAAVHRGAKQETDAVEETRETQEPIGRVTEAANAPTAATVHPVASSQETPMEGPVEACPLRTSYPQVVYSNTPMYQMVYSTDEDQPMVHPPMQPMDPDRHPSAQPVMDWEVESEHYDPYRDPLYVENRSMWF